MYQIITDFTIGDITQGLEGADFSFEARNSSGVSGFDSAGFIANLTMPYGINQTFTWNNIHHLLINRLELNRAGIEVYPYSEGDPTGTPLLELRLIFRSRIQFVLWQSAINDLVPESFFNRAFAPNRWLAAQNAPPELGLTTPYVAGEFVPFVPIRPDGCVRRIITDRTIAEINAFDVGGTDFNLSLKVGTTELSFSRLNFQLSEQPLSSYLIMQEDHLWITPYTNPQSGEQHLAFETFGQDLKLYKSSADAANSFLTNFVDIAFDPARIVQQPNNEFVVTGVQDFCANPDDPANPNNPPADPAPTDPDPTDPDPTDPEENMSALQALQQIWDKTQSFYGVCFVDELSAGEIEDVTDWCQSHYRLPFFVVTDSADAIAATTAINQLNYYTHVTTYHQSHDEVGAIMGMALDQKFDQPNGIKTLKFKTLVGTPPTPIGETLAGQLDAAGVNYYTSYGNPDAPVLMYSQGFAGAGKFADFVMGLHWLRNDAQVEVFNTFRINPKVSQTEGGMSVLKAGVARSCMRGVDNGLIAGGQWNGQPLGTVNTGDFLPTGYYIYADKIRNQTQQVRETRQAQPISVLVKGAGALHGADISFIGEQ